jgi:predicted sulfurtransferase
LKNVEFTRRLSGVKPDRNWAIAALACFILIGCAEKWSIQLKVPRMTKEELKSLLGNPDVIIVDVRESEDYKKSEFKIQGAIREDAEKNLTTWADKYSKDKTLVFYCT